MTEEEAAKVELMTMTKEELLKVDHDVLKWTCQISQKERFRI